MKHYTLLSIVCVLTAFYTLFYLSDLFPIEKRDIPYAKENPIPEKRYKFYVITDESGQLELMKIPLLVRIGDEILSHDNKLYRVVRIEENHAYAEFIRQVKL